MYYSSGNYEAFATPKKPEGVDHKSAYIIGSGLAALTAACYLVRDGQMKGEHVRPLLRCAVLFCPAKGCARKGAAKQGGTTKVSGSRPCPAQSGRMRAFFVPRQIRKGRVSTYE